MYFELFLVPSHMFVHNMQKNTIKNAFIPESFGTSS